MTESEWTDEEQGWMLAIAAYRASLCPGGCGQKREVSLAKGGAHEWRVRKLRCHACDALAIAQDAFTNPRPQAMLWAVEKR